MSSLTNVSSRIYSARDLVALYVLLLTLVRLDIGFVNADEHKRAVKGADFNSSALAEHAWTEGHPVDRQNVSILSCCPDSHHRLVKEAILIRTSTGILNRDIGMLPPEYDNLLQHACIT